MSSKKITIGVCGARRLGTVCLRLLTMMPELKITAVCFPKRTKKVWWKDVVDEDEVNRLGFKITPWEEWKDRKFDLVFSVLHDRIFKKIHIANSRYGIINLHTASLPKYRGSNTFFHAIANGEKEYQVTLHYVDEGIDSGPIIAARTIKIDVSDTGWNLYKKAQQVAYALFSQNISTIISAAQKGLKVASRVQNSNQAVCYPRIELNNQANLKWNKERLYNFVRALEFPPFEPAYILLKGKKIFLTLGKVPPT